MDITVNQGEQDVLATVAPKTAKGNPAQIDGVPEYIVESGDVTVEPAEDGLSAKIITGGLGVSVVRTRADADLGEGVVHIEDVINITVVSPQAENLGLAVEAVDKAPA